MSTLLVDHYLLQLKSLLPAKQRDDIAAELRESILSAVEERERTQGRALSDAELNEVLRSFGHPMVVAGRYLPMQHLIGPDVFPLYWYALQAVLIVTAVVGGLLIGVALLTAPRAVQAAVQVGVDSWWFALQAAALVTLIFAVLDHSRARLSFLDKFDARKADAGIFGVRAAPLSAIARSDTLFEIATTALLLAWWVEWLVWPSEWLGVVLRLSPAIEPLFYPVLVLCAVELVRLFVDLVRPYRTVRRVALRLVLNLAWLGLFVLAFRTAGLVEIAENIRSENPERVLQIAQTSMRVTLFVLALVCAGLAATDIVRLFRR
jgi:hypothetical protein